MSENEKAKQVEEQKAPRRARLDKTTYITKEQAREFNSWIHIDAKDQVLGRLAAVVATRLRGKDKPEFTPNVDVGDYVVITNAKEIVLTGKKWKDKMLYDHTGYIGNLVSQTAEELHAKHPDALIRRAVSNMLPKNTLGRHMIKKLKIYAGPEHDHDAQQPKTITVESRS